MALMLGACSGAWDKMSELTPKASDFNITSFEFDPYSRASASVPTTFTLPPVTPADYVNADGSCAGAVTEGAGADQPVVANVGLTMTECQVVRILGAPERVDIGTNARSEREVKLLYSRGAQAGLYSFTGGRMTDVQRVAEPEPPPKPKRQPAKPPKRAT